MGAAVAWSLFEEQDRVFAARVLDVLTSHPHHVIATLRADGSPRVGGSNVFVTDGVLWIGMMPQAARVADLRRDPRCAVHSAPVDEALAAGDARLQLVAFEETPGRTAALLGADHPSNGVVFSLAVAEASLVRVDHGALVLETWRPGAPLQLRRVAG